MIIILFISEENLYIISTLLSPIPIVYPSLFSYIYMTPIQYNKLNIVYNIIMIIFIEKFFFIYRISYDNIIILTMISISLSWNISMINNPSRFVLGLSSIIISIKDIIIIPLSLRLSSYYQILERINLILYHEYRFITGIYGSIVSI
jgi:hypothetical protein